MTRRNFLKALVVAGAVAATDLEFGKKLLQLKDYPQITYQSDYIPQKCTTLHKMQFTNKNGDLWEVVEYADDINEEIINIMLETSIKAGLLA